MKDFILLSVTIFTMFLLIVAIANMGGYDK